jgi:hypothetical protein
MVGIDLRGLTIPYIYGAPAYIKAKTVDRTTPVLLMRENDAEYLFVFRNWGGLVY